MNTCIYIFGCIVNYILRYIYLCVYIYIYMHLRNVPVAARIGASLLSRRATRIPLAPPYSLGSSPIQQQLPQNTIVGILGLCYVVIKRQVGASPASRPKASKSCERGQEGKPMPKGQGSASSCCPQETWLISEPLLLLPQAKLLSFNIVSTIGTQKVTVPEDNQKTAKKRDGPTWRSLWSTMEPLEASSCLRPWALRHPHLGDLKSEIL